MGGGGLQVCLGSRGGVGIGANLCIGVYLRLLEAQEAMRCV